MKRTILLLSALFLCGCSGPRHASPAEFQERYAAVGQPDTMRDVAYLGRRDGRAFIRVSSMSTVGGRWSDHIIYADLADLDPAFRDSLPTTEMDAAR